MKTVQLLAIDKSGKVPLPMASFPKVLRQNCEATADFYKVVGFEPPWIGYVVVGDGAPIGIGAFKGPPQDNRAEIAYFTLPEFEGQGFTYATAKELIRMARDADPGCVLVAQTQATPNGSNALLRRLGFTFKGSVTHPEDGEVWEWQLAAKR